MRRFIGSWKRARLELAERHPLRVGRVPGLPLVGLAHVEQHVCSAWPLSASTACRPPDPLPLEHAHALAPPRASFGDARAAACSRPCPRASAAASRRTTNRFGTLYPASVARQCAASASRRRACVRRPAATSATTISPQRVVGHADDHAVEHVGCDAERELDLFGVDLLAAGVDARRAAAEQPDRAVGVDRRVVAGDRVAPAVDGAERRRRLLRVLVVAERDRAADAEHADPPVARLHERRRRR